MANGDLLNENISMEAWKGYVAHTLQSMDTAIKKLYESFDKLNETQAKKEDLDKILRQFDTLMEIARKCDDCEIEDVKQTLYGKRGTTDGGLVAHTAKLENTIKIKSSTWGIVGGIIQSAIAALIFFLSGMHGSRPN